jgi:hypothetical protein
MLVAHFHSSASRPRSQATADRAPVNVTYLRCPACDARFYAHRLFLLQLCPACEEGPLLPIALWDLMRDAFFPLTHTQKER